MDKDLTVVQINALGATTSTGRTTREMHDYFVAQGYTSIIATACNKDCDDGYAISSMNAMHIDVGLTLLTGLEASHSLFPTLRLIYYLDTVKPDVVHLRILHNSYVNLKMLLKYLARRDIPTVITLHDMWFLTGHCCYYHTYPCDKWMTGCFSCPEYKITKRRPLFDRTALMWKIKKECYESVKRLAVVGNSIWTTKEAKKSILKNAKIVRCVYNWIDFNIFYPRNADKLRDDMNLCNKKVIMGVSVFWSENDRKGFSDYLRLAEHLDDDQVILLVGKMNFSGVIPDNIVIVPPTNDADQLAYYYSMADVLLNLSQGETFGKVAAEAISCGTPVIALNNTANPEIVPEGGGAVIESTDYHTIKEALKKIFSLEKKQYETVCVEYARKLFDKETNIKAYIDIYRELMC